MTGKPRPNQKAGDPGKGPGPSPNPIGGASIKKKRRLVEENFPGGGSWTLFHVAYRSIIACWPDGSVSWPIKQETRQWK